MAETSEKKKKGGPGRPFQKGQTGNPGGVGLDWRARRRAVAEALDKAFVTPDGRDTLVEIIHEGAALKDATCLKLASSYRWGTPEQKIELTGPDNGPVRIDARTLTDDELAAIAAQGRK